MLRRMTTTSKTSTETKNGRQGFRHIGFLVDDVYSACDDIRKMGFGFREVRDDGSLVSCLVGSIHIS